MALGLQAAPDMAKQMGGGDRPEVQPAGPPRSPASAGG